MNQVEVKRRQIEICSYMIGLINILAFGRILGNNGITYFVIALEGFCAFGILSSGALSDTLGRMLRMRIAKGQYKNAMCIRKRVLILAGGTGAVLSILFAACAGMLSENLFAVPHSSLIMSILAPALFMRTISAVLIGFFQGEGSELPAVIAAPLRQVLLLVFGLLFVKPLSEYGGKVSNLLENPTYTAMYAGVGIAVAIALAELMVLVFLSLLTLGNKQSLRKRNSEGMRQTDSWKSILRILWGSMWMPVLIQAFELLPMLIGTVFYRKSVENLGTFAENFGMFTGKVVAFCGIWVLLICAILICMDTRTVNAFRKDDIRSAKMIFQSGLHIGVIHGLFCSVYVAIMAEQLGELLSEANGKALAELLRSGSICILFAGLFFYLSRLLLLMGRKYHLLGCLGIVNIVFIIVASVLLNSGETGILSVVYAGIFAMVIGILILGFLCCRMLHTGIGWLQVIAIPVGAICVTGLACMFLGKLLTAHLGNGATALVCLAVSVIIDWSILLFFRSFTEQELNNIPGGGMIRAAGQLLGVFNRE